MEKNNTFVAVGIAVILLIVMFISTILGFIKIANAKKLINENNNILINEYEEENYDQNIMKNIITNVE